MNKNRKWGFLKEIAGGRLKDFLLLSFLAILLLFFAGKIFQSDDSKETSSVQLSENEKRVMRLLKELDGVGEAEVIVYETNEEIQSVIIICDGANDFNVIINVREAVSAALGTKQSAIKIYLKKE